MKRFLTSLLKYAALITFLAFLGSGLYALGVFLLYAPFVALSWAASTLGVFSVPILAVLGCAFLLALPERW